MVTHSLTQVDLHGSSTEEFSESLIRFVSVLFGCGGIKLRSLFVLAGGVDFFFLLRSDLLLWMFSFSFALPCLFFFFFTIRPFPESPSWLMEMMIEGACSASTPGDHP